MIQWQKSTYSGGADGNECVEIASSEGDFLLRESDAPARILPLTPTTLSALLTHLHPDRP
ncbi:DUF397 domain-containing protein [Streptomyces sp. NPDC005820]|uniref:DUF397 domain-containing protein n=1 Tax=Streptomyces sp. NPDC005820 TaxID=3157069 RepID=UPI0033FDE7D8